MRRADDYLSWKPKLLIAKRVHNKSDVVETKAFSSRETNPLQKQATPVELPEKKAKLLCAPETAEMRLAVVKTALNIPNIKKLFGKKVCDRIRSEQMSAKNESDDDVFDGMMDVFQAIDPSPTKEYVFWTASNYAKGTIKRYEDLGSRVMPALERFDQLKKSKKLPESQRDIMKLKGLTALEDLVDQYKEVETTSNREKETRIEQDFFKSGDALLIYNDAEVKVVVPKTQEASCFFGVNTKWCTAAKENNMFSRYAEYGDLYIVLFKAENKRYQFNFETSQFMDERDEEINPVELADAHPILWKVFSPIAERLNSVVLNVDPSLEIQIKSVRRDPHTIRYIKDPSETVQQNAADRSGLVLSYITNPSDNVQFMAIRENANSIKYIKNPSEARQLQALERDLHSYRWIEQPTEKATMYLVKKNPLMLKIVAHPSEEVQMAAVELSGDTIQYIDDPSEEVQLASLGPTGRSLTHIKWPSEAVQLAGVSRNGMLIGNVGYSNGEKLFEPSEAVQLAAVKQNGRAIQFLKNPSPAVQEASRQALARSLEQPEGRKAASVPGCRAKLLQGPETAKLVVKAKLLLARPTQNKIETMAKTYKLTPEQVELAIAADPSPNQTDFVSWICKQVAAKAITLPEDTEKIQNQLKTFVRLKRSPTFTGEKDIQRYTPATLYDVTQAQGADVSKKQETRTLKEEGRPGAKVIYNRGGIVVYEVTEPKALMELSSNTNWCTNQEHYAKSYLKSGPDYVVYKDGKPYGQCDPSTNTFMNVKDEPFSDTIHRYDMSNKDVIVNRVIVQVVKALPDIFKGIAVMDIPLGDALKNANTAFEYAMDVVGGRFPEGEALIASDGDYAYEYALDVLKAPFPLGEPVIAKYALRAVDYAKNLLKGRFEDAEPAIAQDKQMSYAYAVNLKEPFPAGEAAIATDAWLSLLYAKGVLHGRFLKGERVISAPHADPSRAYDYARHVINGPWPPGEENSERAEALIATHAESSYKYADDIIQGAWPQGEEVISKHGSWSAEYAENVLHARFPKGEPAIAAGDPRMLLTYIERVVKGPFPLGEDTLAKHPGIAYEYARDVLHGRFRKAEKLLADQANIDPNARAYAKEFLPEGKFERVDESGNVIDPDGNIISSAEWLKQQNEEYAARKKQEEEDKWPRSRSRRSAVRMDDGRAKLLKESSQLVVESPAFQSWFAGSKVTNPDGSPKRVYHGTGADIQHFTFEYTNMGLDQNGSGFYFTDHVDTASGYSTHRNRSDESKPGGEQPNVIPVYLCLKNPLYVNGSGESKQKPLTRAQIQKIVLAAPDLDDALSNWGDVSYEGRNKVLRSAVDAFTGFDNPLRQLFTLANDLYGSNIEAFNTAVLKATKYDSVIAQVTDTEAHYIAWFPSQIRSAISAHEFATPAAKKPTKAKLLVRA